MLRKEKKKGDEFLISMSDLPCTLSTQEGLLCVLSYFSVEMQMFVFCSPSRVG